MPLLKKGLSNLVPHCIRKIIKIKDGNRLLPVRRQVLPDIRELQNMCNEMAMTTPRHTGA